MLATDGYIFTQFKSRLCSLKTFSEVCKFYQYVKCPLYNVQIFIFMYHLAVTQPHTVETSDGQIRIVI